MDGDTVGAAVDAVVCGFRRLWAQASVPQSDSLVFGGEFGPMWLLSRVALRGAWACGYVATGT